MKGELSNKLPSFWVPALGPESNAKMDLKKPDTTIYCPMSGKPISMKDLIDVKFKKVDENDSRTSLITKSDRYMCSVTNDVLSNSIPCAVLRTSYDVKNSLIIIF